MNAPSLDIANLLDTAGVGTVATDIFIAQEPDKADISDNIVTVYDVTGEAPEAADVIFDKPAVQVRIRNSKYLTGYAVAESIKTALHKLTNTDEGNSRYITIWAETDILSLGTDSKDRYLLTINFRIHRTDI